MGGDQSADGPVDGPLSAYRVEGFKLAGIVLGVELVVVRKTGQGAF
jgi:hypothetical protein